MTCTLMLSLVVVSVIYCQSSLRDSFRLYDDLFWEVINRSPEEAVRYARKTMTYAQMLGDARSQITGLNNLAVVLMVSGRLDSAECLVNQAIALAKQADLPKKVAAGFGSMSNLYFYIQDKDMATEYADSALAYALKANDTVGIVKALGNKGTLLERKGKLHEAARCLVAADSLCSPKMCYERSSICNSLGMIYGAMGELEQSNSYFKRAYRYASQAGASNLASVALTNLGGNAFSQRNLLAARTYYLQADSLLSKDDPRKATIMWGLGQIALAKKESDKAYPLIRKALAIDLKRGDPDKILTDYILLAKILKEKKQYSKALKLLDEKASGYLENSQLTTKQSYYELKLHLEMFKNNQPDILKDFNAYLINQDSMLAKQNREAVIRTREKYEAQKKQDENEKLASQAKLASEKLKNQKRLTRIGVISVVTLFILLSIIYFQNKKLMILNSALADENKWISLQKREIAHRSKNQLALALNLTANQKYGVEDMRVRRVIEESESRLRALASVNKRLLWDGQSIVNIREVLEDVVANNIYGFSDGKVEHYVSIVDLYLESSKATTIALIVNELMLNTFKHAGRGVLEKTIIHVAVTYQNGFLMLTYADNGNVNAKSLNKGEGLTLIDGLLGQINGSKKTDLTSGFRVELKIPI